MLRKPILLVLLAVFILAFPVVASDSGSTPHNAEPQAAPTDSALKLAVRDQIVSWENPYPFLSPTMNQMLYFLLQPRRSGGC
jgi:hypothetical protein